MDKTLFKYSHILFLRILLGKISQAFRSFSRDKRAAIPQRTEVRSERQQISSAAEAALAAARGQWPSLDPMLSLWLSADTDMWHDCRLLSSVYQSSPHTCEGCRWPTINKYCPLFNLLYSKKHHLSRRYTDEQHSKGTLHYWRKPLLQTQKSCKFWDLSYAIISASLKQLWGQAHCNCSDKPDLLVKKVLLLQATWF